MTTYIALLRAINVGGHKKLGMSELGDFVSELGFDGVETLLQTGNVVFKGRKQRGATIERLLESEAKKLLNLETDFFVRTGAEWGALIGRNPFREEAKRDPSHLVVLFLNEAATSKGVRVRALQEAMKGPERVRANGKHLYVVYPAGIGRSKLTNTLIEDRLGTRATGRNWNTVLKIGALAKG